MRILNSLESIDESCRGCCLTIGNFDGVHIGHVRIISEARRVAEESGASRLVAMTFEPHPAMILHPERELQVLTPFEMKARLLAEAGVDDLVVVRDSYQMLTLSPEDFVDNFLMKRLSPKAVVEGSDFHFGYGRSGNTGVLGELGKARGFETIIIEPEEMRLFDEMMSKISSTAIRHLLQKGRVGKASMALGRNYRLMGQVISGRGKGRQLGFPTANIEPEGQIVPAEGVYAGLIALSGSMEELCREQAVTPAIFSIGRAKTFISDHPLLIEAHVLDSNLEDICGKFLAMDFVEHIRGQQRFSSEDELKKQIAIDCDTARSILKG